MEEDAQKAAAVGYDAMARAMALEVIVTRILASQAERIPDGVAARMIADPEAMASRTINALPEEMAILAPLIST